MWIKVVIVFLFVALVISLFTGLGFLISDKGEKTAGGRSRVWNTLCVRLLLASLLIGFIIFGVYTGQLGSNAPWDQRRAIPLETTPETLPAN